MGEDFEQTFLQGRHKNNIISHHGNQLKTTMKYHFISIRTARIKEVR